MGTDQHPEAAAFEAGLLDHPHDLARWSAYSDYLTEQGDPRGEFMRVQLALEDESLSAEDRKKLKTAEAELLAAHEREWLGPLAAFTVDAEKEVTWRRRGQGELPPVLHSFERGWLRRVEFLDLTVNQARALAACPGARLLGDLVVEDTEFDDEFEPGPDVPEDAGDDQWGLHALLRCPHLPAVRSFRLGELMHQHNGEEYSNCHTPGELAHHFAKQMPRLEVLDVYARPVDTAALFALPMPRLTSITVFHTRRYELESLASNKTLTALTTLRCHPHAADREGGYLRLSGLRALCRAPHLKALTHLCLRISDFGDDGIKELIDSGMLARLKVLDLRAGCVTDQGAGMLAAALGTRKLEFLNLRNNALTARGVNMLAGVAANVDLTHQHNTTSVVEGEYQEFLYDGDIE